jgi:hypothetical protein
MIGTTLRGFPQCAFIYSRIWIYISMKLTHEEKEFEFAVKKYIWDQFEVRKV